MPTSYSFRALIHDGVWSQIFRARRDTDGVAVILKVLRSESATAAERNRLIASPACSPARSSRRTGWRTSMGV
jgi:hypothetical protein